MPRQDNTLSMVEAIGLLNGKIDRLEQELSTLRGAAERQRAACARHVEDEAAVMQATAERLSDPTVRRRTLEHAASLRSIAREMRARAVVR